MNEIIYFVSELMNNLEVETQVEQGTLRFTMKSYGNSYGDVEESIDVNVDDVKELAEALNKWVKSMEEDYL